MNEPINDGGPAFPVPMFTRQADGQPMSAGDLFEGGNGLSLRDWFAGMALQGLIVNQGISLNDEVLTRWAYWSADSMLKARKAPSGLEG